mmetsp:Transcript_26103/g.57030  ORF Transcript_26103/g.57030 Transcript_26103/m.57030 type:complete len:589 (-) Transcript_26103:1092-2858(-)
MRLFNKVLGLLTLQALFCLASASEKNHKYGDNEAVVLWVNKVGPYNNPQETYNYYYLPFCKPFPDKKAEHSWGGLGEVLQGNELINSQLEINFKVPLNKKVICSQTLSTEHVSTFEQAVQRQYWYELFLDDLPIWGFVGEAKKDKNGQEAIYIYTHKAFDISYNKDKIIQVNLTSDDPVLLEDGAKLTFTYSVTWYPTSVPFARRFERYLDYSFFEHKIHWFSIFNSFMMVMFLTGLVAIILMRTLRKDYARYAKSDDDMESLERDLNEESGWKLVHGDVFRPPRNLVLLAACVGTGMQLALLSLAVILLTIAGNYFEERGTILTAFIVCYALTSFWGGYTSGGFYARNDGKHWIRAMLLTACLFPGVCFAIAFSLNTIAIFYHSLAAVPFGYIMAVILLWSFISFPLCLIGTVIGRNWNSVPNNPCRVKRIPSPIPDRAWYLHPWSICLAGGLLPFGSIFIEMYFIFTSFWGYKVYYVYGFMLLVVLILMIVTASVTIVGTYFLLNAENYHWQWTSFGMSSSTALYVFLYSIHYFLFKTKMSGLFQTCFYFGYMSMFCIGLSLMCGAVGYLGAAAFVRTIYRNVKCD